MSVQHFIEPRDSVVITLCSGEVTFPDVVASLTKLRKDPAFRPGFRQLADLSGASHLRLDFKDLCGIYHVYDPFSNEGRRAIVAPGTGATFGLARMYQSIVDNPQLEVFQSLLGAIAWVGLDVTILEASIQRMRQATRSPVESDDAISFELPSEVPTSFRRIRKRFQKGSSE